MTLQKGHMVRRLLIVLVTVSIAAALGAANAQATDDVTPPFVVPPPATEVRPPTDPAPVAAPYEPAFIECSDWYLQSDYGATWSTGSSWWEYRCSPIGMFDQARAFWTDYYHWTGSGPVFYGRWVYGYCWCWWDASAGRWFFPYPYEW